MHILLKNILKNTHNVSIIMRILLKNAWFVFKDPTI